MSPIEKKIRLLHFREFIAYMLSKRNIRVYTIERIIHYNVGNRKSLIHTTIGINSCIKVVIEYYRAYERWCALYNYTVDKEITEKVMKMYK